MNRLIRTRMGRWMLAALAWTAIGMVFALPALSAGTWRRSVLAALAQWWSWGLVSPIILCVDRRLPFSGKQLFPRMLAHLFLSLLITVGYVYVYAAVRVLFGMGTWGALLRTEVLLGALRGMFLWSWLVYWLIVGAWQVYRDHEHYLSSELRLERLERSFTELA